MEGLSTFRDLKTDTSPNRSITRKTSRCSANVLGVGKTFRWSVLDGRDRALEAIEADMFIQGLLGFLEVVCSYCGTISEAGEGKLLMCRIVILKLEVRR